MPGANNPTCWVWVDHPSTTPLTVDVWPTPHIAPVRGSWLVGGHAGTLLDDPMLVLAVVNMLPLIAHVVELRRLRMLSKCAAMREDAVHPRMGVITAVDLRHTEPFTVENPTQNQYQYLSYVNELYVEHVDICEWLVATQKYMPDEWDNLPVLWAYGRQKPDATILIEKLRIENDPKKGML